MININDTSLCENCFSHITGEPCPVCGYDKNTAENTQNLLRPGSILLGKYIVGKAIGVGGFGATYLGYDVRSERKIAIKEYFPQAIVHRESDSLTVGISSSNNNEAMESGKAKFYEEAKLVSRFNGNQNIVSVYEFFYENNTAYFAMEYLSGTDLKHYIKDKGGKITQGEAITVLNNVSSALMIAHTAGVLHRDISPDNIFICDDGSIKLIDFGAARQYAGEQSKSMSVILKQGFAPLEQYQKRGKQGPWTDIYALGATAYYALSGQLLDDPISRLDNDTLITAEELGIDENLYAIIMKCIRLQIPERYPSVFELKNDLNALSIDAEPVAAVKPVESMPVPVAMPSGSSTDIADVGSTVAAPQPQPIVQTAQQTEPAAVSSAPLTQAVDSKPMYQMPSTEPRVDEAPKPKSKKPFIIGGAVGGVLVVAAVIAIIVSSAGRSSNKDKDNIAAEGTTRKNSPVITITTTAPVTTTEKTTTTTTAETLSVDDCLALGDSYYNKGNYGKALEYYEMAAKLGNSNAMVYVGEMYLYGEGVVASERIAFNWFDKAAKKSNSNGIYYKGLCYYNGYYVSEDKIKASEYFVDAADKGNVFAYGMLGECYYYGYGLSKDDSKAFHYYKLAYDNGNYDHAYNYGNCYLNGRGTGVDYNKAIEVHYKNVELTNDAASMNQIGYCYEQFEQYSDAFQWYLSSAQNGDIVGMYNVSLCYYYGRGTTENKDLAKSWLRKSIDGGDPDAPQLYEDLFGTTY